MIEKYFSDFGFKILEQSKGSEPRLVKLHASGNTVFHPGRIIKIIHIDFEKYTIIVEYSESEFLDWLKLFNA